MKQAGTLADHAAKDATRSQDRTPTGDEARLGRHIRIAAVVGCAAIWAGLLYYLFA